MLKKTAIGLVLAWLVLWVVDEYTQSSPWDTYMDAGTKAYQQGNYPEAERQFKGAVKEAEGFGLEAPRLTTSLNDLGALYRAQGKYAEAEPLLKRSLAILEKALRREHPDVAQSLNNLALLYDAQGRYAKAEPLSKRSLAIWEKALGPDHPNIAKNLENYADLLRETGRGNEVLEMIARAGLIRAQQRKENPSK